MRRLSDFAPHYHLSPQTQSQRNGGKFDVTIRLTKDTARSARMGRALGQIGQFAVAPCSTAVRKRFLPRPG